MTGDVSEFIQLLILVILVMIALICVVSLYLSGRISKPVEQLTRATRLLSQGHLTEDLEIDRKDELGQLTADFNAMRQANWLDGLTATRPAFEPPVIS